MTEKNYVIVFDPLDARFDPLEVKKAIRSDGRVTHWWNHIANSFLVTFEGASSDLSELVQHQAKNVDFFVMEVDPRNSEGSLAERSWKWIRHRERDLAEERRESAT